MLTTAVAALTRADLRKLYVSSRSDCDDGPLAASAFLGLPSFAGSSRPLLMLSLRPPFACCTLGDFARRRFPAGHRRALAGVSRFRRWSRQSTGSRRRLRWSRPRCSGCPASKSLPSPAVWLASAAGFRCHHRESPACSPARAAGGGVQGQQIGHSWRCSGSSVILRRSCGCRPTSTPVLVRPIAAGHRYFGGAHRLLRDLADPGRQLLGGRATVRHERG